MFKNTPILVIIRPETLLNKAFLARLHLEPSQSFRPEI